MFLYLKDQAQPCQQQETQTLYIAVLLLPYLGEQQWANGQQQEAEYIMRSYSFNKPANRNVHFSLYIFYNPGVTAVHQNT